MAELGNELLEAFDRAASSHPRLDRVAVRADPVVLRLQVEIAVKIEARAIFIELGPQSVVIDENDIDLLRIGEKSALDRPDGDAFGSLAFLPLELRDERRAVRQRALGRFHRVRGPTQVPNPLLS